MAKKRLWIPAALTLAGIGCGFVSLICLMQGRYAAGMLWMALAVFFDGIDGKVASMLDARSELGAVLDSKADVVSFAVLPGVAAYLFFHRSPDGRTADHRCGMDGRDRFAIDVFHGEIRAPGLGLAGLAQLAHDRVGARRASRRRGRDGRQRETAPVPRTVPRHRTKSRGPD